jgi:hypothetical protein
MVYGVTGNPSLAMLPTKSARIRMGSRARADPSLNFNIRGLNLQSNVASISHLYMWSGSTTLNITWDDMARIKAVIILTKAIAIAVEAREPRRMELLRAPYAKDWIKLRMKTAKT